MFKKGDMLVQIKYNCSKDSPFAIFTGLKYGSTKHLHLYSPRETTCSGSSFRHIEGKDWFHKDYKAFLIMHSQFLKGQYKYAML